MRAEQLRSTTAHTLWLIQMALQRAGCLPMAYPRYFQHLHRALAATMTMRESTRTPILSTLYLS